jgi:sialidase-1
MVRRLLRHLLLLLALCPLLSARSEPAASRVHAWYRPEGLQTNGARVTAWENEGASGRSLTRVVGKPVALRIATRGGERTVMRLDGKSALWQPATAWGSLATGRTVVAYVRLAPKAAGVLFDGSTNSGMTRAQVRDGNWQAGVQPPPIANADAADPGTHPAQTGVWQVHAFTFHTTAQGTDITHRIGTGEAKAVNTQATAPLSGFILGANTAARRGLACDVAEVLVYDRTLDGAELAEASAYLAEKWGTPVDLSDAQQPKDASAPDDPRVFRTVLRQSGDDGAHTYRIPGLTTTKAGTLLAVFDVRHANSGDLPGDIDVGLRRSTDGGTTWEPMRTILDYPKDAPGARGNGVGDPCIVADQETGEVFVAALWSKGNRGWFGSGPGMTPDETGQFVIARSNDDGKTWSSPLNITAQVKRPEWRLCFDGPGRGIQTRDGTLVLPAQFIDAEKVSHSFFIFSEDHGRTWQPSPPAFADASIATTEAQVAELPGGEILISMRNHDPRRERAWATFRRDPASGKLAGGSWSPVWFARDDPVCMASLVTHPQSGALLFANPATKNQRARMTVSLSRDGGRTWPVSRLLDARPCAYSCLTVLPDGAIGLLYETGDSSSYETLTYVRFPFEWLTNHGAAEAAAPVGARVAP